MTHPDLFWDILSHFRSNSLMFNHIMAFLSNFQSIYSKGIGKPVAAFLITR